MKLFDTTLTRLEQSLDARLLRQNVLAGNLANADTPGYVPREVDFARALEAAQAPAPADGGATGFLPLGAPEQPGLLAPAAPRAPGAAGLDAAVVLAPSTSPSLDGNGVDIDKTMVGMAQNALQYGAAARAAGKKLAILRYVASDGNA